MKKSSYARIGQLSSCAISLSSMAYADTTGKLGLGAAIMIIGGIGFGMLGDFFEKIEANKQKTLSDYSIA